VIVNATASGNRILIYTSGRQERDSANPMIRMRTYYVVIIRVSLRCRFEKLEFDCGGGGGGVTFETV